MVGDDGFIYVISRREREVLRPASVRRRHRLSSYGKTRDSSGVRNAPREGDARSFGGASVRVRYDAHDGGDRIHCYVRLGVRDGSGSFGERYEYGFFFVSDGERYVEISDSASGNASGICSNHVSGNFVIYGFSGTDSHCRSISADVRATEEYRRSARGNDRFSNRSERYCSRISDRVHHESGIVYHSIGERGKVEIGRESTVVTKR